MQQKASAKPRGTAGRPAMGRKALLLRGLAVERFKKLDKELHEITPGVFLGSCGAAYNVEGVAAAGVTHVLCVATNLLAGVKAAYAAKNASASRDAAGDAGSSSTAPLVFLEIAVEDKPGCAITDYFPACFEFIDGCLGSGGHVLVLCFLGKSRSASVVVGYLMKKSPGTSFEDALGVV